jgi:hypothetical protein
VASEVREAASEAIEEASEVKVEALEDPEVDSEAEEAATKNLNNTMTTTERNTKSIQCSKLSS